ncbi:glucoamylase family protein [Snuella lapsa]|uniref:Glucoamylase family protein n=1 Tax=Snuella lapsa TaxID=870481 RepID=A0ABP6X4E9_9FLAO
MNLILKTIKIKIAILGVFGLLLLTLLGCSKDSITPPPPDVGFIEEPIEEQKLPLEELLEIVQQKTFNYFWDFAETNSGMAKERSQPDAYEGQSSRLIATGGSGFGIACFPVAVTRGWITREDAIQRMDKILSWLENADKFHGAFAHWYYGDTGKVRPFSEKDNGGDIVETAFLMQGLLINRQFFSNNNTAENAIRNRITALWEAVEWDWYARDNKILMWHWSPNYDFQMGMSVGGWNEALMAHILAAASPTHGLDKEAYEKGWGNSGGKMINGNTFYGIFQPLGIDRGGPLFWAHYSFIGLDPRGLSDQYANYFEQNKAHTLINYNYCMENPKNYKGYGGDSWGLTSSDNHLGYGGHEPGNDLGVIAPTAALSSFPYTPVESQKALEYFYYEKKDDLWGPYGFYDAFSEHHDWVANGYIAIDQGPIVAMIENYRTQLLWNLFMQDQDVINGLTKLGFNF